MLKKKIKGFTLIEMMVAIAIIGILLGFVMVNISKQQKKSRDNVRVADIQKIRLALDHYRLACGEFPATLDLSADNGCRSGVTFADFINEIPVSPSYSSDGSYVSEDYLYAGLSTTTNGRCYEYHIAAQLEYGADNDFSDGEQADFLSVDHDYPQFDGDYDSACQDADNDFSDADDDSYGLYDFRSTKQEDF